MLQSLILLLGALSNCFLRGSDYVPAGRYVNAFLFGLVAYFASHNVMFGGAMASAMVLGQLWGIPHQQTLNGNWTPMFFRGVLWACCIAIPVTIFFYTSPIAIAACLPAALSMYLIYRSCDLYFKSHKSNIIINQVTVAEMLYGVMLWLPIFTIATLHLTTAL